MWRVNGNSDAAEEMKLPAYYIYIIKIWWNSWYIWHYLQSLILVHPSNQKAELTEESAYVSVLVALFIFMALMHENSDILDADGNIDDNQQD